MYDRSVKRGKTTREHDDSKLIDNIEPAPTQQGRSGGNLQKDVKRKPHSRAYANRNRTRVAIAGQDKAAAEAAAPS